MNGRTEGGATSAERRARHRSGLASELLAAIYLFCCGYRILARRFRTHSGEIDLIAAKGRLIAFIEVKRRLNEEAAASAIAPRQRQRILRTADAWMARNRRYADYDRRFDVIFLLPRRWPRHLEGGL